jgi:hypothetical protein
MIKKKLFCSFIVLAVLNSCKFKKSNTVYDSFLEDETLAMYLTFNGDFNDKSNARFKNKKGEVQFDKDRFENENSAAHFIDKNYLSYGDILDSVLSGEKKRFSFSFWVKPSNENTNAFLISKNADSNCEENERQFNVKLTKENKISFLWLYNNSQFNGWRMFESKTEMKKEEWQNVIITYNGHSNGGDGAFRVNMFINGKREDLAFVSKRGRLGNIEDKNAHFSIGNMVSSFGDPCTNFFHGLMDDIMVFERVLTPNEIEYISSLK